MSGDRILEMPEEQQPREMKNVEPSLHDNRMAAKSNVTVEFLLNQQFFFDDMARLIDILLSDHVIKNLEPQDQKILKDFLYPYRCLITYTKLKSGENTNLFNEVVNSNEFNDLVAKISSLNAIREQVNTAKDYTRLGQLETQVENLQKDLEKTENQTEKDSIQERIEKVKTEIDDTKKQIDDKKALRIALKAQTEPLEEEIARLESVLFKKINSIIKPNSAFSNFIRKYKEVIHNQAAFEKFISFRFMPFYPEVYEHILSELTKTGNNNTLQQEIAKPFQNAPRYELTLKDMKGKIEKQIRKLNEQIKEREEEVRITKEMTDEFMGEGNPFDTQAKDIEGELEQIQEMKQQVNALTKDLAALEQQIEFIHDEVTNINETIPVDAETEEVEKRFMNLRNEIIDELETLQKHYEKKNEERPSTENNNLIDRVKTTLSQLREVSPYNEELKLKKTTEGEMGKKSKELQDKKRFLKAEAEKKKLTKRESQLRKKSAELDDRVKELESELDKLSSDKALSKEEKVAREKTLSRHLSLAKRDLTETEKELDKIRNRREMTGQGQQFPKNINTNEVIQHTQEKVKELEAEIRQNAAARAVQSLVETVSSLASHTKSKYAPQIFKTTEWDATMTYLKKTAKQGQRDFKKIQERQAKAKEKSLHAEMERTNSRSLSS